jgi:hypothetical protein
MVLGRGWFPLGLLMIGVLWGCRAATSLPPTPSSPFFTPTAEDTTRLSRLTHELDNRALHCLEVSTCEEVHFARGLVSLFESQEAARASFRRVIEYNRSSSLAGSSKLWLQFIGDTGTGQPLRDRRRPHLILWRSLFATGWHVSWLNIRCSNNQSPRHQRR